LNLYTVREVAKIFRRTPETILRWIEEEKIQAVKLGSKYLIKETEISRVITSAEENFTNHP